MLDCAEAELAIVIGFKTKKKTRGDLSHAFCVYVQQKGRYDELRSLPTLQNVSDDALLYMTSESGAIVIHKRGDASAHGNGQGEKNLDASIIREPEEVQHILKEIQHLGLKQRWYIVAFFLYYAVFLLSNCFVSHHTWIISFVYLLYQIPFALYESILSAVGTCDMCKCLTLVVDQIDQGQRMIDDEGEESNNCIDPCSKQAR